MRRPVVLRLTAAAAACIALAVAAGYAGREPRLMDRATKVYDLSNLPPRSDRVWITDERLLLTDVADRTHGFIRTGHRFRDLRSGEDTPLIGLQDYARTHPVAIIQSASPGGKWLALSGIIYPLPPAVSLDGKQSWSYDGPWTSHGVHWLADGSGWIAIIYSYSLQRGWAEVHRFERPQAATSLPLPPGFEWDHVIAAPSPRRVITSEWLEYGGEQVVSVWDLVAGKRTHQWAIPAARVIYGMSVSPTGDRVLYEAETSASAWTVWLQQHLPFLHVAARGTTVTYVRRLDGSNMRVLDVYHHDTVIGKMGNRGKDDPHWQQLQWLPSGKALSFTDGASLYTVPAP